MSVRHQVAGDAVAPRARVEVDGEDLLVAAAGVLVAAGADGDEARRRAPPRARPRCGSRPPGLRAGTCAHCAVRSSTSRAARYASGTMPAYASCHDRTCTRAMSAASPSVATRIVTSSSCSTMDVTLPHGSDMTKAHEVTTSWAFERVGSTSDGALHLAGLDARGADVERLGVPPTTARTRWMFGFQRRCVRGASARCCCRSRALAADVAVGSHGLLLLLFADHVPRVRRSHGSGRTSDTVSVPFPDRWMRGPLPGTTSAQHGRATGRGRPSGTSAQMWAG